MKSDFTYKGDVSIWEYYNVRYYKLQKKYFKQYLSLIINCK